jgi:hypothetical protein
VSPTPRSAFGSNWLAGLVLGAVNGTALLSLGMLILPLLLASLLLIAWKGPRLIAGAGFLTGAGLLWTVLFLRVALTCGGPLDTGAGTCVAGDLGGWIAGAAAILVVGLLVSAAAFRRLR